MAASHGRHDCFGPTLPPTASAGHGSYLAISCHQLRSRITAEDDPLRMLATYQRANSELQLLRVLRPALASAASFPLNVGRLALNLVGPLIAYRVGGKCGKIDAIMKTNNSITAAVFSAFLKCPTKAHLLAIGEPAPCTYFADIDARISSMYKAVARRRLGVETELAEPLDFGQLWCSPDCATITHDVDCETAVYDFTLPPGGRQSQEPSPSCAFVPVLFLPWDKPSLSDSLLVCFGALALSQTTGILPDTGTLIFGDGCRHRNVKIGNHVARTRQIIDVIGASCQSGKPAPLVLNRHCAVCDFQLRCRDLAIERDDLSLLTAMTGKERAKCNAKGISTITQLSYGYRPRRRKRTRPDADRSAKSARRTAPVVKNDHKLKALAIKKNQIHVVGAPSLRFDGTPIFLDVEGMSDRDFYYLIGLRSECGCEQSPYRNGGQFGRLYLREDLFSNFFEQPQGSRSIPRF